MSPGGADGWPHDGEWEPAAWQRTALAFTAAAASGRLDIPLPGSGATRERWAVFADLAAEDLSLARLGEGHADAVAILAELGGPRPEVGSRWGVWAANPPGPNVTASRQGGGWVLRGLMTELVRLQARTRPFRGPKLRPGVYGKTLHVSGTGEWDFDTDLKPLTGFPVTFGWMNAIRRGHARVHRGIETGVPVLVLRSGRSHFTRVYSPECDRCDLVLDTRQIGQWAGSLGSQVTDVPIEGARHDVFLSVPEVRARAYAALSAWLDQLGSFQAPNLP